VVVVVVVAHLTWNLYFVTHLTPFVKIDVNVVVLVVQRYAFFS